MKPALSVLASALLIGLPTAQAAPAKVGEAAPAFTLTDSTGAERSLADFAGKTVVLEWTNHECPFVKKHYNAANIPSQQREAVDDDVVWLVLNSSAPGKQGHVDGATANRIQANWKAAQTHYLFDTDGSVGRAYAAKTTPHMYIIDPEGVLRYAGAIDSIPSADTGDIPEATQYVPQALAELAAGKPVSLSTSQPYGCSIKYKDA
ncbi:redoxin family protein [Pseudomarimonas salicorniae]|uniref:Redoxin domain-containing protein n=1 Tax=Pseudomarimonas salicorniae TaxID=2933270 RepID=A0ABT0GGF3_9GAMM|nr:redoxin family protein [Lysobacter sp. CAU 1642]MCK7593518.1 redoxin domain-containing protein [Lysobacter sp. CAU 1642]